MEIYHELPELFYFTDERKNRSKVAVVRGMYERTSLAREYDKFNGEGIRVTVLSDCEWRVSMPYADGRIALGVLFSRKFPGRRPELRGLPGSQMTPGLAARIRSTDFSDLWECERTNMVSFITAVAQEICAWGNGPL